MDKSYLSLLDQSFHIRPINNRHAACSSLFLPPCSPTLMGTLQDQTITHPNKIINIYSRTKKNISEHMSSEKHPPSPTYGHWAAFMPEDNQSEEFGLSAVFGNDLTRPTGWPSLGSLLVVLSCYVPSGVMRLALLGFCVSLFSKAWPWRAVWFDVAMLGLKFGMLCIFVVAG